MYLLPKTLTHLQIRKMEDIDIVENPSNLSEDTTNSSVSI